MNTVLLALDKNYRVIGTHPLIEPFFGEGSGIGHNLEELADKNMEFLRILDTIRRMEAESLSEAVIDICFDHRQMGLSSSGCQMIRATVSTSKLSQETMYFIITDYNNELKEYSDLVREKERLHSDSIHILNDISGKILNEPSSKMAARQSLEIVANLFKASMATLRLCSHGKADLYVAYGLTEQYQNHYAEVLISRVPDFARITHEKKPLVNQNPQEGMGYLFPDLRKQLSIKMVVSVPILEQERVIGLISLGFDQNYRIVKESLDILENVVNEFHFLIERNEYFLEILNKTEQLKKLNIDIVTSLTGAIETRDSYTNGHSVRVALYAGEIARNIGWDDYELGKLNVAGLLHDIGKVGIPDAVLLKPRALSKYENEIMRFHPDLSAKIVSKIENFQELVPWVRYHHEHYDGTGYPYGLKGKEIPMAARIIAVADAYDAMTSDRPYRKAMSLDMVEDVFKQGSGVQWDNEITSVAIANLEVLFRDTMLHYNMPEKLTDFRKMIFNISLMSGLYLYEHIYHEAELYIEQKKPFTLAQISLKNTIGHMDRTKKKEILESLIEMSKAELHYPILLARYDYHQIIAFAPMMNKQFVNTAISRLQVNFFKTKNIAITTNLLNFPDDYRNPAELFEHLVHSKKGVPGVTDLVPKNLIKSV